jgi:hypothetical protein
MGVRHFHAEKGETATKENLRKSRVPLDAVNHRLHTHPFCQKIDFRGKKRKVYRKKLAGVVCALFWSIMRQ